MNKPVTTQHANALGKDEIKYLERTLGAVPLAKVQPGAHTDVDALLKFGYHTNPYVRVFCKVLWSGYAIAQGALADGHQRFVSARKDADLSAVDAMTARSLDDAHGALEAAMAPTGSMQQFLVVLRDKTLQRLWSRVCETLNLPPPRFHVLYGAARPRSAAEIEAEEAAELAKLRLVPEAAEAAAEASVEAAASAATEEEEEDEDDDDEGPAAKLTIEIKRSGSAETAPEWLLAALAEALRELRTQKATGALQLTLSVQGEKQGGGPRPEGGKRRRRRRR